MKTLLQDFCIIPMDGGTQVIEKGFIIIEDNIIADIGSGETEPTGYDLVIKGKNQVVLPGFINTHTHAAMTLLRGYADDLPLKEWLETKIWPLEDKLTAEDIYWGTMLAIAEMIKSGTTTFADMYFCMDEVAQAVDKTGIRACLSRGMIGIGPESEQAIADSRDLVSKWHNHGDGRITVMLGPHAPYTCPPEYLQRVADLAGELDVGIHIHVAETLGEVNDIIRQYGKTPVELLKDAGLFKNHVLAAHCVHMSENDIAILAESGASVAHNPESNMKLASGIAPVPKLLSAGIPVALGTDGASSNNDLDMLQEMRTCALLHKVNSMDPTVLPAYKALEMATVNGAQALGLSKQIGRLQKGYKADMIIIDLDAAHQIPRYDLVANLVYAGRASDVDTVIIDGNIIMENRQIKTLNEEQVITQIKKIAARLMTEVKSI
ncbi:MAG TPA: amidohydrolase [Syntrophomonadaceae bacterium]|nr:amidohydrolase [Syntrophomonadaceae bacterium]HPR93570.1 amidohydrolase [Syntrophomonadaceae bacterium]